jgi:endonuclease YncB( thermonuclease family)
MALVLTLCGAPSWAAETLRGTCVDVPAADTLRLWLGRDDAGVDAGTVTVRLAGVDTVSLHRHFGSYARLWLRDRALGRPVTVEVHGREPGGTVTGRVIVDHRDLSYQIVSEGLARPAETAPPAMRLMVAEDQARARGRGMWAHESGATTVGGVHSVSNLAWRLDHRRALDGGATATSLAIGTGEMSLGSWLGAHHGEVLDSWGMPTSTRPDGRGGMVMVYDRCGTSALDPGCRELLHVGRDGVVYRRAWEGR